MRRLFSYIVVFLMVLFIVPALLHLAVWSAKDKPSSWHSADWSSANILPKRPSADLAQIMIFSARTGGLKGAFATHSWIVLKKPGQTSYTRYDVVGWGRPVRKNGYDADARWYSNRPELGHLVEGERARQLIPKIEQAISDYPWSKHGDYTLWPGPNSNTFVASILRKVPELGAATVSTAVGRDFPDSGRFWGQRADGTLFLSAAGYAGLTLGSKTGLELNFLGLVAGISPAQSAIKIPAFGTFNW